MKRKWKVIKKLAYWIILVLITFIVFWVVKTENAKAGDLAPLQFEAVARVTNAAQDGVTTAGGGFGVRSAFGLFDPLVGVIECGVGVRSQGVRDEFRGTEEMIIWSAVMFGLQQYDGAARYLLRGEFTSAGPVSWIGAEIDAHFFSISMATAPTDLGAWKLDWGLLVRF